MRKSIYSDHHQNRVVEFSNDVIMTWPARQTELLSHSTILLLHAFVSPTLFPHSWILEINTDGETYTSTVDFSYMIVM
jgi:hypothetical protein